MNRFTLIILLSACLFAVSCSTAKYAGGKQSIETYKSLSAEDKELADTLIKKVLDNEGLYTVISNLKPMSSVTELYLNIAARDSTLWGVSEVTDTTSPDLQKLKKYQRVVNALQFGDLRFMISPYKLTQKQQRVMQISVHRRSLIDSLVRANQSFFGQFGFVPGLNPEILVNTTEYEHKFNRFRAYGYLFGYPEHAVTFFTEASISESRTGNFVKRDALQIPVYSSKRGRFVYVVPTDYHPAAIDSAILKRADYYLMKYQAERARFTRPDGSVKYYALLQKLIEHK